MATQCPHLSANCHTTQSYTRFAHSRTSILQKIADLFGEALRLLNIFAELHFASRQLPQFLRKGLRILRSIRNATLVAIRGVANAQHSNARISIPLHYCRHGTTACAMSAYEMSTLTSPMPWTDLDAAAGLVCGFGIWCLSILRVDLNPSKKKFTRF